MNYRTIRTVIYSTLLLLVFLLPASAQQKNSRKVTLNVRNGTMESIIQSIMKQTSVKIVYNQELVQKAARMDFTANNEELKPVIRRLLKGSKLTFVQQDDVMVIGPKDEPEEVKKKTGVIKGQVTDNTGKPLVLVTVSIPGSQLNTITNEVGEFTIDLSEGSSLAFSSVGFIKQTIKVHVNDKVNVQMEPSVSNMDEVVVTGYQTVNKRLSASSTFTLKGSELNQPGVTNVLSMLQGKVPGLSVVNNSGSVNAVPSMRIRGTSTLVGNANPLIVVDGVVRENPNDLNPDNLLGADPNTRDVYLLKDVIESRGTLTGNSISGLNAKDVESITFLKDASATAIYGTRAANGVIVITTKSGKAGKMAIDYSLSLGTALKPRYDMLQLMNSQQRIRFSREMYEDGYLYPSTPFHLGYEGALQDLLSKKITESQFQNDVAGLEKINTDWLGLLFQSPLNMGHHLSFSGGSDKTTYYTSVSYQDNRSAAKEDRLRNFSADASLKTEITRKLKLNFNLSASQRISNGYFSTINPLDYALKTSRAIPSDLVYKVSAIGTYGSGPPLDYNFLNEIKQTGNNLKNTDLSATLTLNYLAFRGLTLSSTSSGTANTQYSEQYATELSNYIANARGYDYGTVAPGSAAEQASVLPFGGILIAGNSSSYSYSIRNSATFARSLFSEKDQFSIVAGEEINSVRRESLNNYVPGYLRDRGESISISPNSLAMLDVRKKDALNNSLSMYGIFTYSYADRYVFNANIRTDASNRFGQFVNQRFLPAWSIAGMWNISSEKWLEGNKTINYLGLKASYGFQGNVITEVGPELILTLPDNGQGVDPRSNEFSLGIRSLPYPGLRWEKTKNMNLSINGVLFNSFLNFELSYYQKLTTDAIIRKYIPIEYGVQTMLINGGNIKNYGYDMDVNMNLIRSKDFNWSISVRGGKNFNVLQKGTVELTSQVIQDYFSGSVLTEDQPVNTFYVFSFKGLDPKTGVPLFYGVDEGDPASRKSSFIDYLKPAGSTQPKISGGFSTNVGYKAFNLGMSFAFNLGSKRLRNSVYQALGLSNPMPDLNLPVSLEDRWRKPGDEAFTNIPAYPKDNDPVGSGFIYLPNFSNMSRYDMYNHSDINVVSGSFLRCTNLNFSYRIGDRVLKRIKLKGATITGAVSNLFVIADKNLRGEDPETMGAGTTALPITKALNLGLSITF
ncbi:SusC/RagA family TonB-linked outer membrane protein [Pedobacter nutrimenti]|uniref:SusC/RagA family TonB-linked outer membrane protein n=1 Tax=Pedobacter nutrimenti TaxID=1241337 RepID=UPI00292DC7D5|nr:SusC/RagA family TonB-linked outer membrane protein [Pedobacter nutrimenti]